MNCLLRRTFSACLLLALVPALFCLPVSASQVDPTVAHGKHVLYVYNSTKLEAARVAVPPPADSKQIPTLEKWRSNEMKVIAYLELKHL